MDDLEGPLFLSGDSSVRPLNSAHSASRPGVWTFGRGRSMSPLRGKEPIRINLEYVELQKYSDLSELGYFICHFIDIFFWECDH